MYSDAVYCTVSVNINPECCFSGAHINFADRHVFPDNKYHGVEPRLLKSALLRDKRYVCCENTVMYQSDHTLGVLLYSLTFSPVSSALVLMLVMLQLVTSIVHTKVSCKVNFPLLFRQLSNSRTFQDNKRSP